MSATSKHSPAPWMRYGYVNGNHVITDVNDECIVYAECPIHDGKGLTRAQSTYNAELVSAAPELYQACLAAQQCINDFLEVYKNGGSMLVMDEAVKSLRDDAGKLIKMALQKANQ